MNVAIYARVSTQRQAKEGYSIPTQIEACRKKASEIGADSIREYVDDGYSGAYLERPALDDLRDALAAKLHDVVIIYDTDRLARDMMVLLIVTEEIEKNAKLVFVNSEYSHSPESQLFYKIKGSFAEYERLKIQDRMNRGGRGKIKTGKPIKDSKILGYDFVNGQYIINPEEAEIVRQIFQLYLDTAGGYSKISTKLFEQGIMSVSGKRFSKASLHAILHRENYTGKYYAYTTYRKKTGANSSKVIHRDSSEWIPMTCPQIIPQELFDAVQRKLDNNRNKKIREGKHNALFQGLLYCGICGRKMYMARYKGVDYYICGTQKEKLGECTNRICNAKTLDGIIWNTIMDICKNEYSLKKHIQKFNSTPKTDSSTAIQKKIDKIAETRKNVMNLYTKSLISIEECTEQLETLKRQDAELSRKLSAARKETPLEYKKIIKTINSALTYEDKRSIVTTMISKITVTRKGKRLQRGYNIDLVIEF